MVASTVPPYQDTGSRPLWGRPIRSNIADGSRQVLILVAVDWYLRSLDKEP